MANKIKSELTPLITPFSFNVKKTTKPLSAMAQQKLLDDLAASFDIHARSATFACGGSVRFHGLEVKKEDKELNADPGDGPTKSRTVQLRFGESSKGFTVFFPDATAESKDFQALLTACQPASFGRGGEEVLDEDYRQAGKLNHDDFATSFCPYESGIIDIVSQLLLPQTSQDRHMRSIKAELYKLNIYSAPSGKFKAHVDTPRSKAQFASLVVSLPMEHSGGSLAVRHLGKEVTFDWSTPAAVTKNGKTYRAMPKVKWAAFYSDCEHEVHEVTAGHRVTLTYNLYVSRGQGHLAGSASSLNPKQLPLYAGLKQALANPGFLRRGQILGIWLTHSYAHTSKHLNFLPSSLKGADISLYETAHALGLDCVAVPVESFDMYGAHIFHTKFHGFNEGGGVCGELEEVTEGWGYPLEDRNVTWLNPDAVENAVKKEHEKTKEEKELDRQKADRDPEEVQLAYMTYGNEPAIDIHYSRAAMFIRIPPYHDRNAKVKPKETLLQALRSRRGFFDDDMDESEEEYSDEYDEDEDEETGEGEEEENEE